MKKFMNLPRRESANTIYLVDYLHSINYINVSSFMLCATLKNQKWVAMHQKAGQVAGQVTNSSMQDDKVIAILDFCSIPRSRKEIQTHIGLTGRSYFNNHYLKPLLASGKLKMTIPDKPNSRLQKYVKS